MVTIRLARAGAKKRPFYHVVATEKSSARNGRFIERLGYYNPNAKGQEQKLTLDLARVDQCLPNGAQLSDGVAYIVKTTRSDEHTSKLQSLMRISYAVLCVKQTNKTLNTIQ